MTNVELQQHTLNREFAALKEQSTTLRQYKNAKASTLSALQVNKWNYNLGRVFAGYTDGLEGEISQEIQRSQPNYQTNGLWIPFAELTRDLSFGGNAGLLVSPDLTGPSIIDGLRPFNPIFKLGVDIQQLPVTGTFTFPREQLVPKINWNSENNAISTETSNPTFDQCSATQLHRGSQQSDISRDLGKLAPVQGGIVNWFRNSVLKTASDIISTAVLAGAGTSNQPLGIINAPTGSGAVNSLTVSSPTLWTEVLAFDKKVDSLNSHVLSDDNAGWVINGNTKASWAATARVPTQNTGMFLYDIDNKTVAGRRAFVSNEVGNNAVYCSRWNTVTVVMGGAVSVLVDDRTQAHRNMTRVTTDLLLDVVLKRPECLVVAATSF